MRQKTIAFNIKKHLCLVAWIAVLLVLPRLATAAEAVKEQTAQAAEEEKVSLCEKVIALNLVQEPKLDVEAVRKALRKLVEECRKETAKAASPRDKIAVLNRVLLADRKVSYLANKYWRDATLAASVLRGRGNCLSTSTLYVLVGKELSLPIHMVLIPGHAFVRWDDGKTRINIETTAGGREQKDADYSKLSSCTAQDKAKLGWGQSQDDDGFYAELLLTAAQHRVGQNRLKEALALLDKALALKQTRLDIKLLRAHVLADQTAGRRQFRREVMTLLRRDNPSPSVETQALTMLARDYGATGDHKAERSLLMRAFAVAPKSRQQGVLVRLAFCHRSLKDFRGAVRYMELAVAMAGGPRDPRLPNLLYNLAILQKNDGRLAEAIASIRGARKMNPEKWSLKIILAGYLVLNLQREEGMRFFAEIKDQKPRGQEEFYNNMIAWFYAVCKQREKFYVAFEDALTKAKSTGMLHWIDQDVDLDVYRKEDKFKKLVAKHRARLLGEKPATRKQPPLK
jgi:regulator of sirC expression with transglutaminase-like and TPR domain